MSDKPMTIKQIADEMGVTKTSIRNKLTGDFREKFTSKKDGTIYIDPAGIDLIKNHFSKSIHVKGNQKDSGSIAKSGSRSKHSNSKALNAKMMETFQKQLAEKDKQIAKLTTLLDQQQQLTAQLQSEKKAIETEKAKKSWWKRLFE